ncbi:MAG: hypothetical protein JW863_02315 [Chitinispirillaceae bacterium]|nr:hypothetical protein [Chitinispirillaceae bacterium]
MSDSISPQKNVASFSTKDKNPFVDQYRSNVKSDLIEITEDKIENILIKHLHKMGVRIAWIAPLSLFVSLLIVNTTATFSDSLGLEMAEWQAIFKIGCGAALVWLVVAVVRMLVYWKDSRITTLVARIKNAEDEEPDASPAAVVKAPSQGKPTTPTGVEKAASRILPTKDQPVTDEVPDFLVGRWMHKYWDEVKKKKMLSEGVRIEKNGDCFRNDEATPYFILNKFNPTFAQGIITFNKVYKGYGELHGRERLKILENGDFLVGTVKHKENDKREYRRL